MSDGSYSNSPEHITCGPDNEHHHQGNMRKLHLAQGKAEYRRYLVITLTIRLMNRCRSSERFMRRLDYVSVNERSYGQR